METSVDLAKLISFCCIKKDGPDIPTRDFVVTCDPQLGRQWVATRDLKAGTILLEETPAFYSPEWTRDTFPAIPNCLTCGEQLKSKWTQFSGCSNCHWPVCSKKCEEAEIHRENECKILSKLGHKFPPDHLTPYEVTLCMSMVRGLGLKRKVKVYTELMTLEHEKSIPEKSLWKLIPWVKSLKKVQKWAGISEEEDGECRKIIQMMEINGFTKDEFQDDRALSFVYLKTSLMNNSCAPNCSGDIGPYPNFLMRIWTSVPVTKGQPLTLTYYGHRSYYGTLERQKWFSQSEGGPRFICQCHRCKDPEEVGTFISGVACKNCKGQVKSYFLPVDPLNIQDDALWECNGCHEVKMCSIVLAPFQKIVHDLGRPNFFVNEKSLEKYGTHLHENHWIIQNITRKIIGKNFNFGAMCKETLEFILQKKFYLLAILDKLSPGLSTDRGSMLYSISQVITVLLENHEDKMLQDEFTGHVLTCKKMEEEALEFYKLKVPPNGQKLVLQAQNLLESLHKTYLYSN